ncbi:Proton channel OtopLc [Nymphon striatum]|nr:Proton channel OtopLc [Nymphon striatum]
MILNELYFPANSPSFSQSFPFDNEDLKYMEPPKPIYTFMKGRHSGSFYLKIGAAVFALGHLVSEGLHLGRQLLLMSAGSECFLVTLTVFHIILPILSFYELFIMFKYSNVSLSRFGFMHLVATSTCIWFQALVNQAKYSIQHPYYVNADGRNSSEIYLSEKPSYLENHVPEFNVYVNVTQMKNDCGTSSASHFGEGIFPFIEPFTIEYHLILVGIWFLQWCHIDEDESINTQSIKSSFINNSVIKSNKKKLRTKRNSHEDFTIDCHSSHRGLFLGMLMFLVTIGCVLMYFLFLKDEHTENIADYSIITSESILILFSLLAIFTAYFQIQKLNVIQTNAAIYLDNLLLFAPLPFVYANCFMTLVANAQNSQFIPLCLDCVKFIQVIVQTTFLIDALRRSSETEELQKLKPGRQMVTFLLVNNLAMWVMGNVKLKYIHLHESCILFYGPFLWKLLSLLTMPFVMFYRFHSTVCLADIWKSAYERE